MKIWLLAYLLIAVLLLGSTQLPPEIDFPRASEQSGSSVPEHVGGQPGPRRAALASGECVSPYIIRPGDTLSGIARRCAISLSSILKANPGINNSDRIYSGQQLRLPADHASASAPAVAPAGSGSAEKTAQGNAVNIPVTGEKESYTVQSGDTLGRIAREAGLDINALMWANPDIAQPNLLYVGQSVRIPRAEDVPEDFRWQTARAERLLSDPGALASRYQPADPGEHWVLVDIASQTVVAMRGSTPVRSFVVSTGTYRYPTVTGQYRIWIKLRSDDMSGPGYSLKDVPYVLYFYKGYGLHGTYWHSNFGTPMSHGCVNLSVEDAAWLFNFASVGTVVDVQ